MVTKRDGMRGMKTPADPAGPSMGQIRAAVLKHRKLPERTDNAGIMAIWQSLEPADRARYLATSTSPADAEK